MKNVVVFLSLIALTAVTPAVHAEEAPVASHRGEHGGDSSGMRHEQMGGAPSDDRRIPLKAPSIVYEHQKAQMREHLRAAQETVAFLAKEDFAAAASTAHEKLGVTPEMQRMCGVFGDETFRKMGMTFHERADKVADAAKTGDLTKTLDAYADMLQACVNCHDTYRFGE